MGFKNSLFLFIYSQEAVSQQRRLRRHMLWGASGHGVYADAKLLVMMHSLRLARTVPEVARLKF
jgi:hypothetical protein